MGKVVQAFKSKRGLNNEYDWGLGVEDPFFFSSEFDVANSSVTIAGTQVTHDHTWPIRYSIIKTSKLGTSVEYYDSIEFCGDQSYGEFQHTFNRIPSGTGYRLEVFNHFRYHSMGRVRIISEEKKAS